MKLRTTLTAAALIGSAGFCGLGGVALASFQGATECADGTPNFYTDDFNHYAGFCGGGAYIQINELGSATGGAPVEFGSTSGPTTPGLPVPVPVPVPGADGGPLTLHLSSTSCTQPAVGLDVYTDGLAHVVGACDDSGHYVEVRELPGAIAGANSTAHGELGFATVDVETQASEDGTDLYVIHPKVEVLPHF